MKSSLQKVTASGQVRVEVRGRRLCRGDGVLFFLVLLTLREFMQERCLYLTSQGSLIVEKHLFAVLTSSKELV